MSLELLGWTEALQSAWDARTSDDAHPYRVTEEHRGRYKLAGASGEAWAHLPGRLRHAANDSAELPGVGDWVAARPGDPALIVDILPRRTALVRKAAGRACDAQLVAANVDLVFAVTSCNDDFNPRRLERYLSFIWDSGADAAIVLNKADLADDPQTYIDALGPVAMAVPVVAVSATTGAGMEQLSRFLAPDRTIAFVGSSGVGKSTLVNQLLGRRAMAVNDIRARDERGQHTTTHRELVCLQAADGSPLGVLIDTPGMRELQLWSEGDGLDLSFADIHELAAGCRFRDCSHAGEPGCAVAEAIDQGELDGDRLAAFHKLLREQHWLENRRDASYKRELRRRGKVIRRIQAQKAKLTGKPQ